MPTWRASRSIPVLASAGGTRQSRAWRSRLRLPVSARSTTASWKTTLLTPLASSGCVGTSTPASRASPAVGSIVVVSMPMVVDLPAPFGPSRPNTFPGSTWKSICFTGSTAGGQVLVRPWTSMTGVAVASRCFTGRLLGLRRSHRPRLVRHCYDGPRRKDVTEVETGDRDLLAEQFQEHRPYLRAVAYRMLGSMTEADDAVQEAWLRLSAADSSAVLNLGGWLTTVVGGVCLDMLRSRRSRREDYVGEWLPEPIVDVSVDSNPEQEALMADSVGLALLVVLECLSPAERLAFVLHDMFGVSFGEIAPIVDRTPAAARQLASRGRRRGRGAWPQPDADLAAQREVVDAFLAAARAGDFEA